MATAAPQFDASMAAQMSAPSPEQMAAFEQMRQSISPKELSDELLSGASQADPQAVAEFRQALEELDVPPEILDLLNQLVDEVLANPDNYEAIKEKYRARGVTEDILPEEFDAEFFAALNVAVDQLRGEPAGPQAFAKGGIAELSPIAKALASYGRNGDTMLAHITPAEARMLKKRGGAGTVNPVTGLPEFSNFFSKIGKAVKKFARSTVGRVVISVALGFLVGPAAAAALGVGAGTAAGVAISSFVGSAGSTLLAGGSVRDALKAGALSGITAGAGAAIGGLPLTGEATMTAGQAFQSQLDKVSGAFAPGASAAQPTLPTQQTLPTQPVQSPLAGTTPPAAPATTPIGLSGRMTLEGMGAPVGTPQDLYTPTNPLLEPGVAAPSTAPGAAATPSISPVAPPAAVSPVTSAGVDVGASKLSGVQTGTQAVSNIEKGFALGKPPSVFDTTTDFLKRTFLPSEIAAQGEPAALEAATKAATTTQNSLANSNLSPAARDAIVKSAYDKAYAAASPGMFAKYGPLTAAGLGIMGLAGGFQQREVTSPYSSLFTGGPGSAQDLLAKNPYLYYLQNLPGVTYYGGSVVPPAPPAPPRYAHGGEVQHFEDGGDVLPSATTIGREAGLQTPPVGTVASAPAVAPTPPVGQVGVAAAPFTQVETPAVGGYNLFSPAAQNMYYGAVNQGLLGGYQYNPATRRNEPVTSLPSAATPFNTASPYTSFFPQNVSVADTRRPAIISSTAPADYDYSAAALTTDRERAINDIYRRVLNRNAETSGLQYWTNSGLSLGDIENQVQRIAGNIGTPFSPSPAPAGGGIAALRTPLMFPTNERLAEIEGTYRSLLGRDPDVAGLMSFADPRQNLTMEQIRGIISASPERQQYLARQAAQAPAPETVTKPISVPFVEPRAALDPFSGLPRIAAQNVAAVDVSKPVIVSSTAPANYDYSAAPLTSDRERQINDLYRSILNRDAEQSGLNYWRDSGLSMGEIESQIRKIAGDIGVPLSLPQNVPIADVSRPVTISSTAPVGYDYSAAPVTNEREQQINDIYRRVLNRDAESGGLSYWAGTNLPMDEIERQIRKIAGDIGVTVAAPGVQAFAPAPGPTTTLPSAPTSVTKKNMGGIASLGRGGYPRRTGQIDGPGTETSDSIPAMLSDGEFVMTAKAVRGAGDGDRRKGAKKMYALMHQLERNASRG